MTMMLRSQYEDLEKQRHELEEEEGDHNGRQQALGSKWGQITIGKPKVWQYERVYALLDGVLRDVEGISLKQLTELDPNAANATLYRTLQTVFELGAQYDQLAHYKNRLERQEIDAVRSAELENLQLHYEYVQALMRERRGVVDELVAVRKVRLEKQQQLASLDADSPEAEQLRGEIAKLQGREGELESQRQSLTEKISSSPPPVTGFTGSYPSSTTGDSAFAALRPNGPAASAFLGDLFENIDSDLKGEIVKQLAKPSHPPTKQIENYHTLLWERLARQLTVFQHDEIRDPTKRTYLLEFDVGISPSRKADKHLARVQFECADCIAYSLYPGQSSYNIANFYGKSSRTGIVGLVSTLFGFGLRTEYRRQKDELRSSLVESVYTAGFGEGTNRFGWDYGAAPFERSLTRGIRRTFALVTVDCNASQVTFGWSGGWNRRDDPMHRNGSGDSWSVASDSVEVILPGSHTDSCSTEREPFVRRLVYNTVYLEDREVGDQGGEWKPTQVILELNVPIDPNLVVTVRGNLLQRARNWLGKATQATPAFVKLAEGAPPDAAERRQIARGILESGDHTQNDVWFTLSSNTILLRISEDTAGRVAFPTIQLQQPVGTVTIPGDLKPATQVTHHHRYGSTILEPSPEQRATARQAAGLRAPKAASKGRQEIGELEPLFIRLGSPVEISAHQTAAPKQIAIEFSGKDATDAWESVPQRVLLQDRVMAKYGLRWRLDCRQGSQAAILLCDLPLEKLEADYERLFETIGGEYDSWVERLDIRQDPFLRPQEKSGTGELNRLAFSQYLEVIIEDEHLYSRSPASLGGWVPINSDVARWYKPWQYRRATNEFVEVEGCGYFTEPEGGEKARIFGDAEPWANWCDDQKEGCHCFELPTRLLEQEAVDFEISTLRKCLYETEACPPNRLPMREIRAKLGSHRIQSRDDSWIVSLEAERLSGGERLEPDFAYVCPTYALCACPKSDPLCVKLRSQRLDPMRHKLELEIPRFSLDKLPPSDRPIYLVRETDQGSYRIGMLPDLRAEILPGALTKQLTSHELRLTGSRAGLIEEILLVGPTATLSLPTRSTSQLAIGLLEPKPEPGTYLVRMRVGISEINVLEASGQGMFVEIPQPAG